MKSEQAWKRDILRKLERLADGKANDAVKLAFLEPGQVEEIDALELGGLAEFKRSGNGSVEIKLTDRVAVLEKLFDMAVSGEDRSEWFFQAMEGKSGHET